ncbi:MAG: PEP-CTERM sorting domain-containing protein [Rubrivivax sp.]|nr:MAG: PEP-CTERM sorting domain-containing protein [Rubrivivax sp.]
MKKLIASLALSALASTSAMASVFIDAVAAPGNQVADFSDAGLIAFNLDLSQLSTVTLNYQITAADLAGPITFNAVIANLGALDLQSVRLSLGSSRFETIGTVSRAFGGTATVSSSAGGASALISLGSPEYYELEVGDVFGQAGRVNWSIATAGLQAGDTLSITLAVPEPQTYAMLIAGLGIVAVAVRRRRG